MSAISILDVQQVTGSSVTSVQTPAMNAPGGGGIVVCVAAFTVGVNALSFGVPTDNFGNTYTEITQQLGGSTNFMGLGLFYTRNIFGGSGFKVTATTALASYLTCIAWSVGNLGAYNGDLTWLKKDSAVGDLAPHSQSSGSPRQSGYGGALTTPAPPPNSFFIGLLTEQTYNDNELPASGWNTTGANGFTSTMDSNSRYGNFSATMDLYTEYKIASVGQNATWISTSSATNFICMCASFAPSVTAIPLPPSKAPLTPCDPQAQVSNGGKGKSGCNTGGIGWESQYTGPYGSVPDHPDPGAVESFAGKTGIDVYAELVHTADNGSVTTYRHALTDLAHPSTYDGGRKAGRLLSLGEVSHGLSSEQGGNAASAVDLAFSDAADRHFRDLLETEDLEGDELRLKAASPVGVAAGTPAKVLSRAVVQKSPTTSPMKAGLSAVDALFAEFGPFGPDAVFPRRKIPAGIVDNMPPDSLEMDLVPLYGEKSDYGARNPITNELISKGVIPLTFIGQEDLGSDSPAPAAIVTDATLPEVVPTSITNAIFIGGNIKVSTYIFTAGVTSAGTIGPIHAWPVFDPAGVTEEDGIALAIHLVRDDAFVSFIAWASDDPAYHPVTNPDVGNVGTGTHDNFTRDAFYDDGSDFTLIIRSLNNAGRVTSTNNVWDVYLVHHAAGFRIFQLYGSDLGGGLTTNTHDRTLIDTDARGGGDVLGPDWPGWPFAERYRDYTASDGTVYRMTVIYARGPLSDDHKNGVCTMAVNAMGIEDVGDGTGLPIIDAFDVLQHVAENFWYGDYTSGLWVTNTTAPKWSDGTYKVKSSTLRAAQAFTASKIGGRGLTVGWYPHESTAMAELIEEWNHSTDSKWGIDENGQAIVDYLDELEDTSSWPKISDVAHLFGEIIRRPGDSRETSTSGVCDWDPDADKFRVAPLEFVSEDGIRRNKNRRKPGPLIQSRILNDESHLRWVLQRRLLRLQYGVVPVTITGPWDLLDRGVATGILLTAKEGTGASGYVDAPMRITWRQINIDDRSVTLTLLERASVLIPAAEQFVVSDGLSSVGLLTSTGFLIGA